MDTESQFKALQTLQQADHDTLVRVETLMQGITQDLKKMNDDNSKVLADHETRLRVLEKANDSYSPVQVFDKLNALEKATTSSTVNWKVVGIMSGVLVVIIGAAATIVAAFIAHH